MTTRDRTIDMAWKWQQLMLATLHCDINPDGLASLLWPMWMLTCALRKIWYLLLHAK